MRSNSATISVFKAEDHISGTTRKWHSRNNSVGSERLMATSSRRTHQGKTAGPAQRVTGS